MRIHLVVVGRKPPRWVREGFDDYAQRLGRGWQLRLTEVAAGGRGPDDPEAMRREGERLLRAVPERAGIVALDEGGEALDTRRWAQRLEAWSHRGGDLALLVGGADGLAPAVLERAEARWSLSALTLPHMLVRVVVAEQCYRAWTLLNGHPYHRS